MGTATKPQRQAMYVAPRSDWNWLLNEQRKLYTEKRIGRISGVFLTAGKSIYVNQTTRSPFGGSGDEFKLFRRFMSCRSA